MSASANVGECEIQAEALKAYNDAEATVEAQAKEVKSALQGAGPYRSSGKVCNSALYGVRAVLSTTQASLIRRR